MKPERKRSDKKIIDNSTRQLNHRHGIFDLSQRRMVPEFYDSYGSGSLDPVFDMELRPQFRTKPPHDTEQNKLIRSFYENNINEFKKLIKNGEDIDCQGAYGYYLVEIILRNRNRLINNNKDKKEFFNQLLSAGLNLQSKKYHPLLSSLIFHGFEENLMNELIKNKININSFGINSSTSKKYEAPIFIAIKYNKKEIIDTLLKNNVDIDVCNSNGEPILNYLLKLPTRFETNRNSYATRLSSRQDAANYAKKFIDMGIDLNQRDCQGNQAIHYLAHFGYGIRYKDLYNDMLDRGININTKNLYGNSPLHYATNSKNHGVMDFLIKKGSELNMHNSNGSNPLYTSTHNRDEYAFNMLLEAGADINNINKYGNNIIHNLILNENTDEYFYNEILKINPKLVNIKNKKGQTPKDKLKMSKMDEKDKVKILNLLNKKH